MRTRGLILIKDDKVIGPLVTALVSERGRIRKIVYDGLVELTPDVGDRLGGRARERESLGGPSVFVG